MRNIFTFFIISSKRNRFSMITAIVIGIVMCLLQNEVGSIINANYNVIKAAIIDEDESQLSTYFIKYLKDTIGIELLQNGTYEEYADSLLNREISVIIRIPNKFQDSAAKKQEILPIEITASDNYANEAYIRSYINGFMNSVDLIAQSTGGNSTMFADMIQKIEEEKVTVTVVSADKELAKKSASKTGFETIMGFYLNFIFFIGLFVGMIVLSDRIDGVFRRIQGTPIKSYQYLIGTTFQAMAMGILTALIYTLYLYGKDIYVGIPLGIIAFVLIIFVAVVIGISMIFALLVKSKIGMVISIYGVGTIGGLLGGAFFPIELAPIFMQRISMITPHYWIMKIIRNYQSGQIYNPTIDMGIVVLYVVLLGLISLILFQRQIEKCDS